MTTVVLVGPAEEQLQEIAEWWMAHREASPLLVLDEFDRCVSLLESSPDAGARFHRSGVPGVRRLVMRRTKHHVYYLHDEPTPGKTDTATTRTMAKRWWPYQRTRCLLRAETHWPGTDSTSS